MPNPLVECVPNFSEARRPEIIEEIVKEMQKIEGVHVLDLHSDADHNRTVVTLVGPPEGVAEAAFLAIAKAAERINLDEHTGAHPRLGATDVVPFVPISGVSMDECVALARSLGQRVGTELNIPVYLYENAATRPDRVNLAAVRKGEYEALKTAIQTDPDRTPDFGPQTLGPAGATVIGARPFLIAYNVYLTTTDLEIAQKIAKTIRHSNGGLRYVKALGLLVEGQAQISMNLTNYRKTSLALVVETIRREAQRYGVGIRNSELVGLTPQEALVDAAVWYTQLDSFNPGQVLENRLYAAENQPAGVDPCLTFLDDLASDQPAPGGGSAAAYAGAMGAGLVAMVARLTIGRKKFESVESQMGGILEESERLRQILTAAVAADAASFEDVMAAFRLPKATDEEKAARSAAIQAATLEAAQIPLETARKSLRVIQLAVQAASLGNPNAITDAGTAASMAVAAIQSAGYNVRINTLSLKDQAKSQELLDELNNIAQRAVHFEGQIQRILKDRGGLPL